MKKLIINADDFGLHHAVNEAVERAWQQGVLTSASLMPGAAAFEDAVSRAQNCPGLGLGVHLTLVGERPVLPARNIPSLVDASGRLPQQYPAFFLRLLTGRLCLDEAEAELEAQLRLALASGLPLTHVDSHQHLHVFPGLCARVLRLAKRYGLPAIRMPAEPHCWHGEATGLAQAPRLLARSALTILARRAARQARRAGLRTTDHFFGMLAGGQLRLPELLHILRQLPAGTTEIMMHPGADDACLRAAYGWPYHWQDELAALLHPAVRQLLETQQIERITFGEL